MFAQAVVAIEIVDHETIHTRLNTLAHPTLEYRAPVRVIKAGPIFLHPADGVAIVDTQGSISIFFEQFHRILHRLGAELGFIPEVTVELKEPSRPLLAGWIAH